MASKNIPPNGWPQLKDLEAVQPTLDRLDKIEAWKRAVKEETFTGEEITIPNALSLPARSLKTVINAIQDLHGYDKPWVGGADVNKFDISSATMAGLISAFGLTVAKDSDGYITITGTYIGESGVPKFAIIPTLPVLSNAVFYLMDKNTDANNNVIQCGWANAETGGVAIDLQNMVQNQTYNIKFRLMIVTDGTVPTSYRPYSNICPISGRTAVVVDDTGRNIWDEQWEVGMISSDNGQNVTANDTIRSKNYIPVTPSTDYYIRCSQGVVMLFYAGDKSYITYQNLNNGGAFTTPQNTKYIRFRTYVAYGTTYHNDICINISDTSFNGQYAPYAHSSVTIQLGTTVYGADINWDTGVMTVTDGMVDLGDLTWTAVNGSRFLSVNEMPNVKIDTSVSAPRNAICSQYVWKKGGDLFNLDDAGFSYYIEGGENGLFVKDLRYSDAASFKTAMDGVTLVYELATPTTIQLTPEQLELLKGYNHITLSDGYGTIEIKALTGANWS